MNRLLNQPTAPPSQEVLTPTQPEEPNFFQQLFGIGVGPEATQPTEPPSAPTVLPRARPKHHRNAHTAQLRPQTAAATEPTIKKHKHHHHTTQTTPVAPLAPVVVPATPPAPQVNNDDPIGNFFRNIFAPQPEAPSDTGQPARVVTSSLRPGGKTAVYNITAGTVTLPNGQVLEAHSGLGDYFDDPSHVNVRMRGSTPPATYKLSLRESMFHGVQALRLTPQDSNIYGRDGLLVHTPMLGGRGDSNGCVSVRDYNSFLKAYQSGEIDTLKVVSGNNTELLANNSLPPPPRRHVGPNV